jgi:hypothetical protein
MVIGKPWEDPDLRADIGSESTGAPPSPDNIDDDVDVDVADDDDDDDRPHQRARGAELEPEPEDEDEEEELRIGPAGIDDPETEWELEETASAALPELDEDEIWLLAPGEDLSIVTHLPKPRHLLMGVAIRAGEIAICSGRRREWCRTPIGASEEDADLPMAHTLRVVFIRHRASGVKTRPRKFIIVTDEDEKPLGWLDYSDAWNFEGGILKRMVDAAGLAYEVERFDNEPQFEQAHPGWVG